MATAILSARDVSDSNFIAECECEMFAKLEQVVSAPEFLKTLHTAKQAAPGLREQHFNVELPSVQRPGLDPHAAGNNSSDGDSSSSSASHDDWVQVEKDDAVQAMAYYIALVVAGLPEAQNMPPAQLQEALAQTLRSLKRSKFKAMCAWGRSIYRWSALSYSALQMYQNPWLIQAVVTAIWTFGRLSLRAMA